MALSGVGATSTSAPHFSALDARVEAHLNSRALEKSTRSRRMSGTSQTRPSHSPSFSSSPTLSSSGSSSRTVRTHSQPNLHLDHPHRRQSKSATSSSGRPTLDHVASRGERSQARTPTRSTRSLPSLDLNRDDDLVDDMTALWAHMPSSPLSPADSPTAFDRDRELLDFSKTLGRRHLTLEYACAAARVSRRHEEDDDDDLLPQLTMDVDEDTEDARRTLVTDTGGDTEDETDEAITPQSSQNSIGGKRVRSRTDLWDGKQVPASREIFVHESRDAELMNAALALCGLAGL